MNYSPTDADVLDQIGKIAACETEAAVGLLTGHVVRQLGAQWYVYSTLLFSDLNNERESYRYFIGCRPEWCELYNRRKWFMNDPFVEYARTNTSPIFLSEITLNSPGRIEMMSTAAEYGFRSGMVIPTHGSMNVNERMGMLYIGSEDESKRVEPILYKNRLALRALAMELLDWWIVRIRQEGVNKFKLNSEEIHMLKLCKSGLVAAEIAVALDLKTSAVYKRLGIIKDKFNVYKIEAAVGQANASGILG